MSRLGKIVLGIVISLFILFVIIVGLGIFILNNILDSLPNWDWLQALSWLIDFFNSN
jgi:hypothetical protein